MSDTTANLALPLLLAAQAQKHVTHNEALQRLDILVQGVVTDRSLTLPPATPAEGECHVVATGAGGAWVFVVPRTGWRMALLPGGEEIVFDGTAWVSATEGQMLTARLGVSATPDATNRLAVSSAATLLTHAGAGHQLKLNKAAAGDTASLLFQTNWSGRAEMGTAGSDDFQIRTSADGSAWITALRIDAAGGWASGRAALSGNLRSAVGGSANAVTLTTGAGITGTPPTGLRLRFRATAANTGAATIALDGGSALACRTVTGVALPAGYLRTDADTVATFDGTYWVLDRQTERGSNANGSYTRHADGSQICSRGVDHDLNSSAVQEWQYAAAFIASPAGACGVNGVSWSKASGWSGRGGVAWAQSVTKWGTRGASGTGIVDTALLQLIAIGYWY